YLQHCYPAQFMNEAIFTEYLDKSQLNLTVNSAVADKSRLFNSFCAYTGTFITFKDFLMTMVALERRCTHGGIGGELRTKCIFRFYAKTGASSITFEEVIALYSDIAAVSKKEKKEDPETATDNLFKKNDFDRDG